MFHVEKNKKKKEPAKEARSHQPTLLCCTLGSCNDMRRRREHTTYQFRQDIRYILYIATCICIPHKLVGTQKDLQVTWMATLVYVAFYVISVNKIPRPFGFCSLAVTCPVLLYIPSIIKHTCTCKLLQKYPPSLKSVIHSTPFEFRSMSACAHCPLFPPQATFTVILLITPLKLHSQQGRMLRMQSKMLLNCTPHSSVQMWTKLYKTCSLTVSLT